LDYVSVSAAFDVTVHSHQVIGLKKFYRFRTECPLGKMGHFKPHTTGWDPASAERLPLR